MPPRYGNNGYGGYNGYGTGYGGYGYRAPQPPQRKRGRGCLAALATVAVIVLIVVAAIMLARPLLSDLGVFDQVASLLPGGSHAGGELTQEDHDRLDRELQGYYVYTALGEDDRACYRIVYDAFVTREARAYPFSGSEDLARVRNYVVADHPELFYISGVNARTTTTNLVWGQSSDTVVEGIYRYDAAQTEVLQRQLEENAAACIAGMPRDADDYEKAKYLYEFLAQTVEYDWSVYDAITAENGSGAGQTAADALVGKSAVCAGYSNAFGYLAQQVGLQSVYVMGTARGDSHAWNVVKLDGDYYYVDATWGDPQFVQGNGEASELDHVNYDYLCVTTSDIMLEHVLDPGSVVPECTATADNYYVREGALLTSADVVQAGDLVQQAYAEGRTGVQMRCTSYDSYVQLKSLLFDVGMVYRYIPGNTCWYTTNDALCSIAVIF